MATVTRVNGSATAVGTLYNPNVNLYIIQVRTASAAVDLTAEDSVGGNAKINGVVENIVKELNPLAWYTVNDATGSMYVILDKALNDASDLQTRIRRLGSSVDLSGTTVAAATTILLS
jgi:hypothetical protein